MDTWTATCRLAALAAHDTLEMVSLDDLDRLYEAHHRVALGLAYRMLRNRPDAEDVVQDAFLSLWRALPLYDVQVGSARTWLLSIVRNRAIDVLRARRRRPECWLDTHVTHADPTRVDGVAIRSADRERIFHLLTCLSDTQREALECAYFEGLTHFEIAALLGVPVGTVKSRIRLALDRLRGVMHEQPGWADGVA